MSSYRTISFMGLAAALVITLAGCGGGGGGGAPAGDDGVPADAVASPEAFSSYVARARADDQAEPMGLVGVMPPASETAEPLELAK